MFNININDLFGDLATATLEIYQGNALTQKQQLTMPSVALLEQYKQLVYQAAQLHGKQPIRVRIYQDRPIYDNDKIVNTILVELDFKNWFDEEDEE